MGSLSLFPKGLPKTGNPLPCQEGPIPLKIAICDDDSC